LQLPKMGSVSFGVTMKDALRSYPSASSLHLSLIGAGGAG
jgi:hypothetical protein